MTASDYLSQISGYYPSAWPAECAGPRRQKIVSSPGLNIQSDEHLVGHARILEPGRWPVMFVQRAKGELYLQGGSSFGVSEDTSGWVEQLDPISLEPIRRSPDLPSGGHKWCGAICVHENGDLYVVNGTYVHRLNPQLEIVAEHRLAANNAHNGHVIFSDGNLVTKDISDDVTKRSVFTVLDTELNIVDVFECPWNSVGRFSSDRQDGVDYLYVTSNDVIHRLKYVSGHLTLDDSWSAAYKVAGEDSGYAWDSSIGDDCAWFMDNGESQSTINMLAASPTGTGQAMPFAPPVHTAPVRVWRVSTLDSSDCESFVPFGTPSGHIVSPPLYDQDRHILVAFDSQNGGIGAWRYEGPGVFTPLWKKEWRNANQLTLYADTGELIVDHVHKMGEWDAVVLDIETGNERGRADTGCFMQIGMWYTPGFERDFYTSTAVGRIGRVSVA